MMFPRPILLVLFNLLAADAFVVNNPSSSVSLSSSLFQPKASTCLRAEEDGEIETQEEASGDSSTGDILNSPAFLKRKIDVLQSDIAQAEADIEAAQAQAEAGKAEWASQIEDLQTEYKNIQERMSSQNKGGDVEATTQVVREVLELVDNFDRAFGVIKPETEADGAIAAEYKVLYDSIIATFEQFGVEKVSTLGTEFDYEVHQAVMQIPSEEYEEGFVCQELQPGYKIGDKLIRAAMVAVAA